MDRKIERKTFISKQIWGLILLGIFLISLIAMVAAMDSSATYRLKGEKVMTTEVISGTFQDYINVRGRVEPVYRNFLDAVEGGIVEKILVDEGATVKKGDTLLVLSNLNLSLNILNSEAQLAEKANFLRETQISMEQQKLSLERELLRLDYDLQQMKRTYDRNVTFYADQMISKDEFLESKEAYQLALKLKDLSLERQEQDSVFRSNQLRKIRQNLRNMERNLELIYQRQDHLVVRAPVNGQLASLNAVPGQSIMSGQRLGEVHVLTDYKLQASIDEHYIDRVHKGLKALLERQGRTYPLSLVKIYPEVNDGQFLVDLVFDEKVPEQMRSGQSHNLSLQLGDTKKALLLKKGAFFQSTGGRWVFLLNKDGDEAVKRSIRIGRQNPKYYEVLEGLEAGDRIVNSDYELFGDSERLKLE